ncbi:MAG: hypothetical protein HKM04_11845 [Legionellales bacterium]|nr:hypothetical protein [Legionellales bacterium]
MNKMEINDESRIAMCDQFMSHSQCHSAPITLHEKGQGNIIDVVNNGTMGFIQPEKNGDIIAITAYHVYEKLIKDNLFSCINGFEFDMKNNLIAFSKALDIATFKVKEKFVHKTGKKIIQNNLNKWPPPKPQIGKGCFFGGFPGHERRQNKENINFGFCFITSVIHSIDDTKITIHMDRSKFIKINGIPPVDYKFGGVSGAPLFLVYETPILTMEFGGIICEGESFGEDAIFFASPAWVISPNGEIADI